MFSKIHKKAMFKQSTLIIAVFFFAVFSCGSGGELPVQFVGCFSSSLAGIDNHAHVVDPLTWKVCVRLCLEKNVKYAGIEAPRSTCYCGNDLVQQAEKVGPYKCDEECYSDKTKTCGGTKFFSMYQLHKEVPLTFMVATDNGIAYFRDKVLSPNVVSLPRISTIKLVYDYAEGQIFLMAEKTVWRTQYKALMMEYTPAVELLVMNAAASSLALDWVYRKLYWTLPHKLVESNLDGSNRRELSYLNGPASDLAIDPHERKLLFIQNGTIHLYDLKTWKMVEKNVLKFNRFDEVTCLTVDPQARAVYAVGFYERRRERRLDVDGYLVSTDYYGSTFRVLLRRRDLSGTFSLTALDGQVFWAEVNPKKTMKALYTYSGPSQHTGLGEPKKLSSLPTSVQDVKLYDQRTQISRKEYLCKKKNCSHTCTLTSASSDVKCGCPENMSLAADQLFCQENDVNSDEDSFEGDSGPLELDLDVLEDESVERPKRRRKHYEHSDYDEYV